VTTHGVTAAGRVRGVALGGHEGRGTPQDIFQATYDAIPANDPFWSVEIGDAGVDLLFRDAVYVRGAMTLQALRLTVGDDAFWRIVRGWASTKSGGNATTEEFIAFAEGVSGQQLDGLFTTWLFTPAKPSLAGLAVWRSGRRRCRPRPERRPPTGGSAHRRSTTAAASDASGAAQGDPADHTIS
jgi:hypothetical protein